MKVRSDILNTYQSIHTWAGVSAALILFIGFIAGSLSLFKPTLNQWSTPPQNRLPAVSNDKLDSLIYQVIDQHPGSKRRLIVHVNSGQNNQSPIIWYQDNIGYGLNLDATSWHGTLDESGLLKVHPVAPSAFAELIDKLHRTAGIPGKIGYQELGVLIMGLACIAYFLALVSGVVLLLPTMTKHFLAMRRDRGFRRLLLDSHNALGLASLPFHLIIALTVIVFAFRSFFYDGLQTVVYQEEPMFPSAVKVEPKAYSPNELITVKQWLEEMKKLAPEYEVTKMVYSNLESQYPILQISMFNPRSLMRGPITDYIFVHPYTGQILNGSIVPGETGFWGRMVAPFYALHFGSFGGNGVRWMYFVLGIMGAVIFYSGNLLWLDKCRRKYQGKEEPKSCLILSQLTVGVCLGSIAGISVSMVAGKWLYPLVDNVNHFYIAIYYALFFAAIIWAFWQGAEKSTLGLLRLTAFACFAIPTTSILALCLPQSHLWPSSELNTIAVDGAALIFGVVSYRLANKLSRRFLPED